jgi:hypothetical protein
MISFYISVLRLALVMDNAVLKKIRAEGSSATKWAYYAEDKKSTGG